MTNGGNASARREMGGFAPDGGDIELLHRPSGFSGAISLPLLPDLIQIYTVSLSNGALTIRRGTERGTIWFDHGEIVHAECGGLVGEDAVFHLLRWNTGQFAIDHHARAPVRTITSSWQNVLMEGCRRLDENAHDASPAEEALRELDSALAGFRAAAIFDANGALVAQRSRSEGLDLAPAGPHAVELLRAHPAALVDCFAILGDQEQLLAELPRERVLLLVLGRDEVNLAIVRRTVERFAAALP